MRYNWKDTHENTAADGSLTRACAGLGAGPDQRRRTETRSRPALHDDAGGDVQSPLAHRVPAGWADADHGEGRPGVAGDAARREDAGRERAGRPGARAGRDAGRLRVTHYATDRSVYLTYSEPGEGGSSLALARAHALGHGERREPRRPPGDLAPDAEGQGGPVRRGGRLLARRSVPVPDRRRTSAHDAGAGSGSGARKDPPADARRQAGARQSDGGEDRGRRPCP